MTEKQECYNDLPNRRQTTHFPNCDICDEGVLGDRMDDVFSKHNWRDICASCAGDKLEEIEREYIERCKQDAMMALQ